MRPGPHFSPASVVRFEGYRGVEHSSRHLAFAGGNDSAMIQKGDLKSALINGAPAISHIRPMISFPWFGHDLRYKCDKSKPDISNSFMPSNNGSSG
jgi:hypothetical protein